jgi:hypothetical protein
LVRRKAPFLFLRGGFFNSDGFVKSPSAALRFNPALLDKKPPFWDAGMMLLIFEGKSPFEKYLTG